MKHQTYNYGINQVTSNFNHHEIKQKLTEGDAKIPDTAQAMENGNMKQSKGVETT